MTTIDHDVETQGGEETYERRPAKQADKGSGCTYFLAIEETKGDKFEGNSINVCLEDAD